MRTIIRIAVVAVGLVAAVAGTPWAPAPPAGAVTEVTYATHTEGATTHSLELKISLPASPTDDMPMVLLISGGGFADISEDIRTIYEAPLNAAGIATAWVEYRTPLVAGDWQPDDDPNGAPIIPCEPDAIPPAAGSCPTDFLDAARAAQHDVQAAVRYLRANAATYDIDPGGIFALGESAGGITAVNLLHRYSDPGTVGSHLAQSSQIAGAISIGGVFARETEQPAGAAPALVFHGEDDFFTKLLVDHWGYDETREMMDRAHQLGNHVELGSICGPLHVARPAHDGTNPLFEGHAMLAARITARTIDFVSDIHGGTPPSEEGTWFGPMTGAADKVAGQYRVDDATPLAGDYDGDGHDDIIWHGAGATDGSGHACDSLWKGGDPDGTFAPQHSTNAWSIFDSTGSLTTSYERGLTPIDEGGTPRIGDYDGDGRDDIFLFGASGTSHHYYADVAGGHVSLDHRSRAVWTTIAPKVGDFDADGKDDLLFWNPASGGDAILYGNGNRTTAWDAVFTTMNNPQVPSVGDFDGDGDDDVYWYGSGSADAMWWSNGTARTFTTSTAAMFDLPTTGSQVHVGDIDGNGLDDLFVYGGGSTRWSFIGTGTHATVTITKTAMSIWLVGTIHIGDFNADGRDDVVLYASGTNSDAYWQGTANPAVITRILPFDVNGTGHTPVLGRFDGDAGTDILWHP